MTCAEAAREYVLTLSTVTALVNQRIFMVKFPQSPTLPAVLFQQTGDIQFGHLRGTVRRKWSRVQCDCIATTMKSARAIDQTIMGGYANGTTTGLLGSYAIVGGSPSIEMIVDPECLLYREDFSAEELNQYRTIRDYKVWITSV